MCGRLLEYEIHSKHKTNESRKVVPVQLLSVKEKVGDDAEDEQRNNLLYHFELHQREGTAIALESYAIGRHLAAILKKGYSP